MIKIVLAFRPLNAATCARWAHVLKSSTVAGPPGAVVDHYEAPVPIVSDTTPIEAFTRRRDRLLAYDIFPPSIVRAAICPEGRITAGATIVQRIVFGPLALEAAVRVIDVWDRCVPLTPGSDERVRLAGFRYVTLQGHPECGVASFEVRLDPTGDVSVHLDARSRPGTWLTRLGRPFARRFQQAVTRAALRRLTGDGR